MSQCYVLKKQRPQRPRFLGFVSVPGICANAAWKLHLRALPAGDRTVSHFLAECRVWCRVPPPLEVTKNLTPQRRHTQNIVLIVLCSSLFVFVHLCSRLVAACFFSLQRCPLLLGPLSCLCCSCWMLRVSLVVCGMPHIFQSFFLFFHFFGLF